MSFFFHIIFIKIEITTWQNLTIHRSIFQTNENDWIDLFEFANFWSNDYDFETHDWMSNENVFVFKLTYFLIFDDHQNEIFAHFFHFASFEFNRLIVLNQCFYWFSMNFFIKIISRVVFIVIFQIQWNNNEIKKRENFVLIIVLIQSIFCLNFKLSSFIITN